MTYSPRELNRGYIDGLITANGSDSDHDIDIAPGAARDSSDSQRWHSQHHQNSHAWLDRS